MRGRPKKQSVPIAPEQEQVKETKRISHLELFELIEKEANGPLKDKVLADYEKAFLPFKKKWYKQTHFIVVNILYFIVEALFVWGYLAGMWDLFDLISNLITVFVFQFLILMNTKIMYTNLNESVEKDKEILSLKLDLSSARGFIKIIGGLVDGNNVPMDKVLESYACESVKEFNNLYK